MGLKILLIEPYYTGSHRAWADGYARFSSHDVRLLTLPGQFWKWRMQGGAVTLSRLYRELDDRPDVILTSDMMDLSIFRAMTRQLTDDIPIALYFHENQLTYPQNSRQKHGYQYAFINYASALAADSIYFNSRFHHDDFFDELPRMLKHFGDHNELATVDALRSKSHILPLGLDLKRLDNFVNYGVKRDKPLVVWNHRWEADKRPDRFFKAIYRLLASGLEFDLALLGENFRNSPKEFETARQQLAGRIVQYGYAESLEDYAGWLHQGDYVVSTADHDFFGIAIAEAIYCGCVPVIPYRLNYPALVTESEQSACLYRHGRFAQRLGDHLRGEYTVDRQVLKKHIAQFDWAMMAPRYDLEFERLAGVM